MNNKFLVKNPLITEKGTDLSALGKYLFLVDKKAATFESDDGYYNQSEAEGFIKLNAIRLKTAARKKKSKLSLFDSAGLR